MKKITKYIFYIWNAFAVLFIASKIYVVWGEFDKPGVGIGAGIGFFVILVVWLIVNGLLATIYFFVRDGDKKKSK